jgi:hypothetical protein
MIGIHKFRRDVGRKLQVHQQADKRWAGQLLDGERAALASKKVSEQHSMVRVFKQPSNYFHHRSQILPPYYY